MCQSKTKKCSAHLKLGAGVLAVGVLAGSNVSNLPSSLGSILAAPQALFSSISPIAPAVAADEPPPAGDTRWTCPMHPHYIATDFGACPICGMDLVKLETGLDAASSAGGVERAVIRIAPEVTQNIGVRLGKATQVEFGDTIRSFGIVEVNERLSSILSARVEGWTEQLSVNAVGDNVEAGQLLFKLFSPPLVVAQRDYLLSLGNSRLSRSGVAQLKALGMQDTVIEQIQQTRQPLDLVPFYAERSGAISELNLKEGGYVDRGMLLATVQDYSSVWLIVGVPEKDLSFITQDTPARVLFPNLPGKEISARVDYIYPTIESETRTGQVRLVIDNPQGIIRPGSYADVVFEVGVDQRLAVPSEAILKSGEGHHIVVSLGQGRFQSKKVQPGLVSGEWTEVLEGIDPNDNLVVSGQFLIDSESALRESFRKLERLQQPLSLLDLTDTEFAMIDHLVDAALYLHESLVDGYDVENAYLDPAISIKELMWPKYGETQLGFVLEDAAVILSEVQEARTLEEIEDALNRLTLVLKPWILEGAPEHYQEQGVVMFTDDASRYWIQLGERDFNPYARSAGVIVPYSGAPSDSAGTVPIDQASGEAEGTGAS